MGNQQGAPVDGSGAPKKPTGKVILHVYDLRNDPQQQEMPFGLGIYHSGVVVFGQEWAFGGGEGEGTGVWASTPKQVPNAKFKEAIEIGETYVSPREFTSLVEKIKRDFPRSSYHLTARNCNHFAEEFCKRLTGKGIPSWVNRAAGIGNLFSGLMPGLGGAGPVPTPESDAAAAVAAPSFVAFTGSGRTLDGKVVDEKKSARHSGSARDVAPDERRQKMLEAAARRQQQLSAEPTTAT